MDMTRAMGKLSNQDRGGTADGQMVLRLITLERRRKHAVVTQTHARTLGQDTQQTNTETWNNFYDLIR